jgi:YebC/PmpR family DNA-binding regulatory protein
LTDNRNRTGSDIRSLFSKHGGSMSEPGAVAWQFERKGILVLPKEVAGKPLTEDDLIAVAVEAGAEDIQDGGDSWEITTAPTDFIAVRTALEEAKIPAESAELTMMATNTVPLSSESDARKVLHLIDLFEDLDDVQNVYANFDIPDSILELVEA